MNEILRVWDGVLGWVYEVWDPMGKVLDRSKFKDELQERFPAARWRKRVLCGDQMYREE